MGTILGVLGYWLPQTDFAVVATLHRKVATGETGSWLVPVVDVEVTPTAVADHGNRGRCRLEVEKGFNEKIALTVTLDDQGLITAVNSDSVVDYSTIIDLAGKAIPLLAPLVLAIQDAEEASLEQAEEVALEEQWQGRIGSSPITSRRC